MQQKMPLQSGLKSLSNTVMEDSIKVQLILPINTKIQNYTSKVQLSHVLISNGSVSYTIYHQLKKCYLQVLQQVEELLGYGQTM